jgi:hypothetical protein
MKIVNNNNPLRLCLLFGLFVFFTATTSLSQTSDDFSDNDFTNNPTWTGATADYIVNTSQQLQLNASGAGTSYITTPHHLPDFENKEWSILVRQNFAGSASNFGRIYLTSNSSDLTINPDGIYLQLGEALSTDAVRLMQRSGGVTTQICASADGTIAAAFIIRIKIIRDNTGTWSLAIDFSGGANYTLAATGSETAVPVGTHIGYLCTYTSGNINRFYLDDVYAGDEIVDTDPPTMTNVQVINSNTIDVLFSEEVTPATAEDVSNYTISLGGISSASLDGTNPALVHLQLADNLVNGNTYTLTSSGIADTNGNISVSQSLNFSYLVAEIPAPGDVIINEFMADPSPVVGLPETEFVEIYNVSNKIFNITGWKLGDNSTFGTITSGWLYPGEYKVLCPIINVSDFPNAVGVTSFPSLGNSSDDIVVTDNNNIQLDKLTYNLSWYQDPSKQDGGWTIERINPFAPCSASSNWRASVDPSGGTPGAQNSVYDVTPDTQAPSIVSISVTAPNEIEIIFDEPVDSTSLTTAFVTLSPSLTETNRTIIGSITASFRVSFSQSIAESQNYSVTVSGAEDCWGNTATTTSTFFIPSQPAPGDVIINEFMADPSPVIGLPEAEFVEIYNVSNKIFNITGWKLGDNSTFGTITSGWLYPGEYKVLCPIINVSDFPNSIGVTSFPSLNNSSDDIIITDNNTIQLDKLSYTMDWYQDDTKKDGGWTIERINPDAPCSQASNWKASVDPSGGTPGVQNSVYDVTPDTSAPFISSVIVVSPNTVNITFNKPIDSTSLVNSSITTNPVLTEINKTITGQNPISFEMLFSETISTSQNYTITINNIQDCWGNIGNTTAGFILPAKADSGDIVLNEVLFDQYTGGSDWIELYNKSDKVINLKGWKIARFNNGIIADHKTISSNYLLQPKDYVVIGGDSSFVITNYPATVLGKFYQLSLPTLANDTGSVIVFYPKDTLELIMDQLIYSSKWHFKLIDSKDGKSLERMDPNLPTQSPTNWHTAAEAVGFATPGGKNSQYYPALYNGEVNLTSEIISPDNDGFEDVLQINYQMNMAGMLGTIKIFDDRGRMIKTVTQNELLGINGTIIWDGIREDGQKATIGTYVLLLQAFDINGGNEFVTKKAFVVAGKM